MISEYESFIRDAARKRGIDPDIAVRVANSEGSVTEPARRGTFPTGSSWWAFQLHYGGKFYEHFGTVAGMGNGFTALTGWQPGDPRAWRDATRYALNRAKASGWGAWYGAAHVGIGQWDGIDRNHEWNAAAEVWDYESREVTMPTTFDPNTPTYLQRNPWTCSIGSVIWMLRSLGINVAPEDAHDAMVPQYVRSDVGLLDASGAGMVAVLRDRWGVGAVNDANATFDEVAAVAGRQPVAIGLRNWGGPGLGHWSAVRGYRDSGNLELANPAGTGLTFGQQLLNREEFDERGPASMVTVPIGAAPPTTVDPRDARIAELEAQVAELQTIRGHLTVTVAGALQAAVDELKRHAA